MHQERPRIAARLGIAVVLFALGAPVALAKIWRVGGDGADFDQIQPAIDAARDGDVILVRPVHAYKSFVLEKGRARSPMP